MEIPREVRYYMSDDVHALDPGMDVFEAVGFLLRHRISGAPVTDEEGKLIGMLTEKDLLTLLAAGIDGMIPSGTVESFMTRKVDTVEPDLTLQEAAGLFLRGKYRRYPVVEGDKVIGLLSRRDVLRAIHEVQQSKRA